DSGDVTNDHGGHESVADLCHRSGELDVGRFEHRIGTLNEGDETAGFNKSNCLICHVFSFFHSSLIRTVQGTFSTSVPAQAGSPFVSFPTRRRESVLRRALYPSQFEFSRSS